MVLEKERRCAGEEDVRGASGEYSVSDVVC